MGFSQNLSSYQNQFIKIFKLCKPHDANEIVSHFVKVSLKARSPHVRKSKTVLDSGLHAVDSRFHVLHSRFLGLYFRFQSPVPGSASKISQIPEFGFPYMTRLIRYYLLSLCQENSDSNPSHSNRFFQKCWVIPLEDDKMLRC